MAAAAPTFDMSQLPSLKDGMTLQEETMKRRQTCHFIEEAGRELILPKVARSTAMVFFHRFYAKHSFQELHDRFEVAMACIVLAIKTEECQGVESLYVVKTEESPPKQSFLPVVIVECQKLKPGGASSADAATEELDPESQKFAKLKKRILALERVILHTIGFELSVVHPYIFLVDTCSNLVHKRQVEYIDATASSPTTTMPGELMKKMIQYSMNFANDSLYTRLCLQFPPQEIATACVYLAGNFVKVKPVDNKDWLQVLGDPDVETLALIVLQLMEPRKDTSVFGKIRASLEQLKATKPTTSSAAAAPKAPPPGAPAAAAVPKKRPPPPPRPPPRGPPPPPNAKRQRVS